MNTPVIGAGLVLGLVLSAGTAAAENPEKPTLVFGSGHQLTLDGQYRIRAMADTGFDFVEGDGDAVDEGRQNVSHRARLGALWTTDQGVEMRFLLQDVRLWGEEANTLNDFSANGLDVYEAWLSLPLGEVGDLKLGRQAFALDDQRIVGAVGWTQRARSFDGGVLRLAFAPVEAKLFGFQLVENDPRGGDGTIADPTADEIELVGAHVHIDLGKALGVSLLGMTELVDDAGRTTLGGHAQGKAAGAHYAASFYHQSAEVAGESGTSNLIALRAGYTLDTALAPSLTAWFEQLSGDGTPQGTFATPYATNHKFYGEMDFFLNTVTHTGALGLTDIGGRLTVKPLDRLGVHASLHLLGSVEPGPDDAQSFGTEVDLKVTLALGRGVALDALYGVFLPGDLIEARLTESGVPEHLGFVTLNAGF